MANPKCGSCRFFQEADLPGCGWCQHPQRKVTSDLMILVRRSELACRNDWSRSLWQPVGDDPPLQRSDIASPLPPTSRNHLRSILEHDAAISPTAGEDVLLSEARIVSEPRETWDEPVRPFPSGNFDPRTAIFRAREIHLQRLREKAAAERSVSVAAERGNVAKTGVDRVDPPAASDEALIGASGTSGEVVPEQEPRPGAYDRLQPGNARDERDAETTAAAADPAQDWQEPVIDHLVGDQQLARPSLQLESAHAPEVAPEVCIPDQNVSVERDATPTDGQRAGINHDLPAWFRADLPRVCRTCRDFRPSADGQRGWCANVWAFTHRQFVQEDDPAPCHSAIGDWWAPADDVWLVAADVSTHGRATPLLDRRKGDESGQRRRS